MKGKARLASRKPVRQFLFALWVALNLIFAPLAPLMIPSPATQSAQHTIINETSLAGFSARTVNGLTQVGQSARYFYNDYFAMNVALAADYDTPLPLLSSNYGATIATGRTGLCTTLNCFITNEGNVVDANTANVGNIDIPLGLAGGVYFSVDTNTTFPAGRRAGFLIDNGTGLIDLNLFSNFSLTTYLNGVEQESVSSAALLDVSLFGGPNINAVSFVTTKSFDEVRLNVGSLIGAALDLDVYYAFVQEPIIVPTINTPLNNGDTINALDATSLAVTGTAELAITVTVTITDDLSGVISNTTTVDGSSNYTATLNVSGLDDGTLLVAAVAQDAAGNASEAITTTAELDQTAPAAPTMTEPVTNAVFTDTTPLISGTGEISAEVEVAIDGQTLTDTVDSNGDWNVMPTALADGIYTPTLTISDPAGNATGPVDGNSFEIDNTSPAAPTMDTPSNGALLTDTTPTISGTGEVGAEVEIAIDGQTLTDTIDSNGDWSVTPTALSDGVYTPTLTITDLAGNATGPVNGNSFEIDNTSPAAPTMNTPSNGAVITDTTPTLSGTGEIGAEVEVAIDGQTLTDTVDSNGDWSVTPTVLADGVYTPTLTITDLAGNATGPVNGNSFEIDSTSPAAPVMNTPNDGSVITDTTPTFSGTGEIGAEVEVAIDGQMLTDTVDSNGDWSVTPTALSDGVYTPTLTITDPAGNATGPVDGNSFEIDSTSPPAPSMEGPGNGQVITDPTPTISGTGEVGDVVTVVIDGQTLTDTVDSNGDWSVTPTALADGVYTPTLTITDPAGNVTGPVDGNSFEIDSTGPRAPIMEGPSNGAVITDTTPTISGTGEIDDVVTVVIDGQTLTDTVDSNGDWSVTPTALSDGVYTPTLTITDPAGNATGPVDGNSFEIDTTIEAPIMTNPTDGEATNNPAPMIIGTGEIGAEVEVAIAGQTLTDTVDSNGDWQVTPATLAEGFYTPTLRITDRAGNMAGPVNGNRFEIDTTKPAVPTVNEPVSGTVLLTNAPTISGEAEPGSTVNVADEDSTISESTSVDDTGNFSHTMKPLPEGEHVMAVTATDPAGNTSDPKVLTIMIDTNNDLDNDGISNDDEAILGTDPNDADSDSSFTSADEGDNGISDADEDLDGDGISNIDELNNGTDPLDGGFTGTDPQPTIYLPFVIK